MNTKGLVIYLFSDPTLRSLLPQALQVRQSKYRRQNSSRLKPASNLGPALFELWELKKCIQTPL